MQGVLSSQISRGDFCAPMIINSTLIEAFEVELNVLCVSRHLLFLSTTRFPNRIFITTPKPFWDSPTILKHIDFPARLLGVDPSHKLILPPQELLARF